MKLLELINSGKLCIRVVSLKSDVYRRSNIIKLLSSFKLDFEFIDAIDGRLMIAKDFFSLSISSRRGFLSPAELGCSLSHQKAYVEFLNSDYDFLMVLEDDIIIDNFSFFNYEFCENLNDLLLILGGQDGLRRSKLLRNVRLHRFGHYAHTFFGRFFQRTCCYVLSKDRASEMVLLWNKGAYLADDWHFIMRNTNIKGILYFPIFSHPEDLSGSVIEEERILRNQRKIN